MQISPHFSRDFLRVFSLFWLLLRSFFFPLYFPFSLDTAFLLFWTSGMRHQDSPGNFLWGLTSWWPLQAQSIVLSCEHSPLSTNRPLWCSSPEHPEQPSDILRGHGSLLLSWGNHNNQSVRTEIVSSHLSPIGPLVTTLHPSDPAFGSVIPPSSQWFYPVILTFLVAQVWSSRILLGLTSLNISRNISCRVRKGTAVWPFRMRKKIWINRLRTSLCIVASICSPGWPGIWYCKPSWP